MTAFAITGVTSTAQTLAAAELGFIGTSGVLIAPSATAITVTGSIANIINQGTVVADLYGIFVNSSVVGTSISNSGEIYADALCIYVNTGSAASGFSIVNSGVIRGTGPGADGIFVNTGGSTIVNHGEISTFEDNCIQINANFGNGDLINRILNTGTMTDASGGYVILTARDLDYLTNTGSLFGSVDLRGGADRLLNSGQIFGDILLSDGDDLFDGRGGSVAGTVRGGLDNDRLIGGSEEDTLRGEEGNDSLYGGAGNDLLSGDIGNNLVMGGAGDDDLESDLGSSTLYGGSGDDRVGVFMDGLADILFGGAGLDALVLDAKFTTTGVVISREGSLTTYGLGNAPPTPANTSTAAQFEWLEFLGSDFADNVTGTNGDDSLRGALSAMTADADTLLGLAGDDRLFGMNGADVLNGGDGADVLNGGLGRDTLTGAAGADSFVFAETAESPDTAARDRINDFAAGVDRIDLSMIDAIASTAGNDAFAFIGTGAFTAALGGQLGFTVSGTNIFLRGDVDGDGLADFSVLVVGVTTISAGDLVL